MIDNLILNFNDTLDDYGGVDQHKTKNANDDDELDAVVQYKIIFPGVRFPKKNQKQKEYDSYKIKVVFHHANFRILQQKIDRIHCQ